MCASNVWSTLSLTQRLMVFSKVGRIECGKPFKARLCILNYISGIYDGVLSRNIYRILVESA